MHAPHDTLKDFEEVYQHWFDALEEYSETDLWRSAPDGGWSLGQVYQHIINGTQKFQLLVIRELLETHEDADQQKTPMGEISYRENEFPGRKFSVHRNGANEPEMTSKMQLRNQMKRVMRAMQETLPLLEGNPPSGKFQHQIFGYLDAQEWFQMIPMHWKHHLRQKAVLDEAFSLV